MKNAIHWTLNVLVATPFAVAGMVAAFIFFSFMGGVVYLIEWIEEDME